MNSPPHSGSPVLDLDHYYYHCRFSPRIHPKADEVRANVRAYYFENLKDSVVHQEKYLAQDLEDIFLLGLPGAREEQIQIATLYYQYFFYYDDYLEKLDEKTAKLSLLQTLGILSGNKDPDPKDQMQIILKDVVSALVSHGDETDRLMAQEVLATTREFLVVVSQKRKRKEALADFETFKKYRVLDGAVWPALALVWWSYGIKLPISVLKDPDIEELGFLTGIQAAFINDLYSYRVEVLRQNKPEFQDDYLFNAVSVRMNEKGVDAQTAMNLIKVTIYEAEEEFVAKSNVLRARFQGGELDMLDKLLAGYQDCMSGNWIWSTYCGRYNVL